MDRITLKNNAKIILHNNLFKIIAITFLGSLLAGAFFNIQINTDLIYEGIYVNFFMFSFKIPYDSTTIYYLSAFSFAFAVLLGTSFRYGFTLYHYNCAKGNGDIKDLFRGFKDGYGKIILANLLSSVFIFFGTVLFIFPGLMLAYRYYYLNNVMIEHPELGVLDSLKLTGSLSNGHKLQIFVLDISFFFWFVLENLTFGLASLYVQPYVCLTHANNFINNISDLTHDNVIDAEVLD